MKCKVCGSESGKYPLCKSCNELKERGLVIKCAKCGQWHRTDAPCPQTAAEPENGAFLYEPKKTLLSAAEQSFFGALKSAVPPEYHVFPQINLAAFVDRTDDARYRNELFRNVDFLITDGNFAPKLAVEINDQSHLEKSRRERDEKVQNILEEAGIPLMKLWTSYGVNPEYIRGKVTELMNAPVRRISHTVKPEHSSAQTAASETSARKKQGCYIATCVYGSYDCPQVWTLRRYRDRTLSASVFGRLFIRVYYALSPTAVRWFGGSRVIRGFWKKILDRKVRSLTAKGYKNTPYRDGQG